MTTKSQALNPKRLEVKNTTPNRYHTEKRLNDYKTQQHQIIAIPTCPKTLQYASLLQFAANIVTDVKTLTHNYNS